MIGFDKPRIIINIVIFAADVQARKLKLLFAVEPKPHGVVLFAVEPKPQRVVLFAVKPERSEAC